jgi:molybdopterin-biosynthesis enzyme MoeA-like protein
MHIGALIIGYEILTGRRQDKHFAHLIAVLGARGLELAWARYAGDDKRLLTQHFREIGASGHLCFSFGGIGATPDDRTRQAIAAAHGVPLVRHPEAVREIEARFGDKAYPYRILMAELPSGAAIVPNPFNRIPGFSLGDIHCLPGFPEMAWPMLEWVLNMRYPHLGGIPPVQCTLVVHGAMESELVGLMEAVIQAHPNVKVSSLPRFLPDGGREVELGARGPEPDAAAAMAEIRAALEKRRLVYSLPKDRVP